MNNQNIQLNLMWHLRHSLYRKRLALFCCECAVSV